MNKVPVAVIEKDKIIIDRILSVLELYNDIGKIKYSNDVYDLELVLNKKEPIIVIIGPSFSLKDLKELLIKYTGSLNYVRIILLADSVNTELLKAALKLNIHDILEYPIQDKDLRESFKRVFGIFEAIFQTNTKEIKESKKIIFFSTKGGSGNTFLTVNFAIALKQRLKKQVIIYDLNYQFGDVALMLNIFPRNTIFDLMTLNKFDMDSINVFLIEHNSGVKILPAPVDPTQGEAIKLEVSNKVFLNLANLSDYLIIDSPLGFTDEILAFLENIDYIFLVATKDVPSIKNLKICLQILERLSFPKDNIFVVLNRADSKVDIEIDEIEKTIQRAIDIKIPSDRIVPISVNKGIPTVISAPRLPVSKSIFKMVDFFEANEKEILEKEKIKKGE